MSRLLIIDDEMDMARLMARAGAMAGYETRTTSQAEVFLELVKTWRPDVAIIDLQMPDVDGVQLLRRMAEERCEAQIVIASGMDARTIQTVSRIGAAHGLKMAGMLRKPFRIREIESVLRPLLRPD